MAMEALPSEYVRVFEDYIRTKCRVRLQEIAADRSDKSHHTVEIDMVALGEISETAVPILLNDPTSMLPLLQSAVESVYEEITDAPRPNLHARVCHFPTFQDWCKPNISALRSFDIGKLLSIAGTVTRVGSVLLREVRREFMCRKCKYSFEVVGDVSQRGMFEMPSRCPRPGEKPCFSSSFAHVEGTDPDCREYQEIKLQEKVQHLHMGSLPRSMQIILTDELADSVKPGDDVLVHGILHRRWNKNLIQDMRADVELMMVAEHVQTSNERKSYLHVSGESEQAFRVHWSSHRRSKQLSMRDIILKSLCPQIYGMYLVKLIVALTLIGGVPHTDPSGARIRGESHLLMVGDPGTAKSQFLRYAAKVSPRSVLTTGIGTTSAGLTVTAVREQGTGEWMLDAGALVLADGGICCIDEFDGIKSHDRGAIHEAMEQQTLSVAKAGLVCTLDTRATVIAAVNPKSGRISTEIGSTNADDDDGGPTGSDHLPITVGIAAPLLSRFDVILTLLDQHNEEWDRQLSTFILNNYNCKVSDGLSDKLWSIDRLRQYFYFIKTTLHPELSDSAMRMITAYYTKERASTRRNAARTTVRLLEALVRLTQAHARLMFRETATAMDAAFAIAAVEASAVAQTIVGGTGALHAPFPDDPEGDFNRYARCILTKLGLEDTGIKFYDDAPGTNATVGLDRARTGGAPPDTDNQSSPLNNRDTSTLGPINIDNARNNSTPPPENGLVTFDDNDTWNAEVSPHDACRRTNNNEIVSGSGNNNVGVAESNNDDGEVTESINNSESVAEPSNNNERVERSNNNTDNDHGNENDDSRDESETVSRSRKPVPDTHEDDKSILVSPSDDGTDS